MFGYLFQFAIATMEGVKSDALFSYQPPFNVLAFLILKPATFILSPRALHRTNVFLIKLTSFPTLILIGIYERYFATGQRFEHTGREAAHSLFHSLPRQLKQMPLVEALVGSSSNDIYGAIFDVDLANEFEFFEDSEDEAADLRSYSSRDSLGGGDRVQQPATPRRRKRAALSVEPPSPRVQNLSVPSPTSPDDGALLPPVDVGVPASGSSLSPLAVLFGSRMSSGNGQLGQAAVARADATLKRVEAMVEDIKDLPVQRLKDEMKDLQGREPPSANLSTPQPVAPLAFHSQLFHTDPEALQYPDKTLITLPTTAVIGSLTTHERYQRGSDDTHFCREHIQGHHAALTSGADFPLLAVDYSPIPAEKFPEQKQHGYMTARKYDAALRPSAAKVSTISQTDPPPITSNPLVGASEHVVNTAFVPTLSFHGKGKKPMLFFSILNHERLEVAVIDKCFDSEHFPTVSALLHLFPVVSLYQLGYNPLFVYSFCSPPLNFSVASALKDLPTMVPRHLEVMLFTSPRDALLLKDVRSGAQFLAAAEQLFPAILDVFHRGIIHRDTSVNNILVAGSQRFQGPGQGKVIGT
ncbi:hypothetical protein DXG03_004361 [Asterophora parasitica]|uniref:Calcium channel YVC1-like C-terminal transmembrane domain-containing protein n=1 Tax=Asterophora parasitica TaxID=117018 RepID=A0A9P7GFN3_9AGAR|nr:hypothetical protein DXG03_004361 [Asterophora parasitica]